MKTKLLIGLLGAVLFLGCSQDSLLRGALDKIVPKDDDVFAKEYLASLRGRDFQTAMRLLDPNLVNPDTESKLAPLAGLLDRGDPISVEIVGCNVTTGKEKRQSALAYQYHFPGSWLIATVIIDSVGINKIVSGVHVDAIPKSLEEINAFTFSGKGVRNYLVFLLAILDCLFILSVLVICIRTKMTKRKWLWILFIVLGIGKLSFNWTTGQFLFDQISISAELFGASAVRNGLYAPWIVGISAPIGAIIFLIKREKIKATYRSKEQMELEAQTDQQG